MTESGRRSSTRSNWPDAFPNSRSRGPLHTSRERLAAAESRVKACTIMGKTTKNIHSPPLPSPHRSHPFCSLPPAPFGCTNPQRSVTRSRTSRQISVIPRTDSTFESQITSTITASVTFFSCRSALEIVSHPLISPVHPLHSVHLPPLRVFPPLAPAPAVLPERISPFVRTFLTDGSRCRRGPGGPQVCYSSPTLILRDRELIHDRQACL